MVELIQRNKSAARRPFWRALSGTLIAVTALGLVGGCGSSSTPVTSGTSSPAVLAHAQIKIKWPAVTSTAKNAVNPKLIPAAANSIKIDISNGTTVVASQVIARPTATADFDQLPIGDLTVKAAAYPTTDGTGTAQASGTGVLTTQAGTTATLGITMDTTITTIKVSPTAITEAIGQSDAVVASPQDASGNLVLVQPNSLVFASGDTSIATVDSTTGTVTGVSVGNTQLTVTDPETGKTGTATITVTSANVAGTVTDTGSTTIAGVRVDTFDDNGTILTTTTGIDGTYKLYVPPGQRILVFTKSGYVTDQKAVVTSATTSKTIAESMTSTTAIADSAAPAIALNAPTVNQASGFAVITGTILRGDGLGVIIVNGGSASFSLDATNKFTYTAILQPGPNIIRVASSNSVGSTVSDPINVNYATTGNVFARVTLTWDGPDDLDLHTWGPNNAHSSFAAKPIAAGTLDLDNTKSFGPENFTFNKIVPGHYSIGVDAYDGPSPYTTAFVPRNATVRVSIFTGVNKGTSTSYGPYNFTTNDKDSSYPVTVNTTSWWRPIDIDVTATGNISVSGPDTTTSLPAILRGNALKKR